MSLPASPSLLAAASTGGAGILCTILLIGCVISLILGLAQLLGVDAVGRATNGVGGRFGALVVFAVLLAVYVIAC